MSRTHLWIKSVNGGSTADPVVADIPYEQFTRKLGDHPPSKWFQWYDLPLVDAHSGEVRRTLVRTEDILRAESSETVPAGSDDG